VFACSKWQQLKPHRPTPSCPALTAAAQAPTVCAPQQNWQRPLRAPEEPTNACCCCWDMPANNSSSFSKSSTPCLALTAAAQAPTDPQTPRLHADRTATACI
jgi:hypothetical protein